MIDNSHDPAVFLKGEKEKKEFGVGVIFHSDPKFMIQNSQIHQIYSTVTDFARFLGLSTSNPFSFEI